MRLTYNLGESDARRVAEEIRAGGGQADLCHLDILAPQFEAAGSQPITDLYYFASSHITASASKQFSAPLFGKFCDYYVGGFARVVEGLQPQGLRHVYYPSSVFVNELPPGFVEYALAKSTGETLGVALLKKYPELVFSCPRLPRMATDQTVGLQPGQAADAAPVILATLQDFQALITARSTGQ